MNQPVFRRGLRATLVAAAASLCAGAIAGPQQYMIKIPISKLAELQGTSIEVTPTSAIFSSPTALGALAGPITVHVRNAGFSPITGIVPSITNGGSDFTLNNECPTTLPGMGSCALTLNFKPTAVGERLGNLAVASSAKNGLQLVPISGTGMAPDATLTAGTFSATQIRETSTGTLVLANPSTAALRLTPAPLTGDFSLAGGSCGATLAAGSSCNYAVDFKPTTVGAKTATFKVSLGVGSFSFDRTAALSATAQAPSGTLGAVDFGAVPAGQGATRDATVTNTGAGPLTLGTPTVAGAGFSIATGGSCGTTLAQGESCTVKVQLLPAGTSAHTGTLTVPVQDTAALTASLAGQSQQAVLTFNKQSIDYGNVVVGGNGSTVPTQLSNTGNTAAVDLTYSLPADFRISSGSCGATLAAGAKCTLLVNFRPTVAQDYTGTFSIASSTAATLNVPLTGTGAQSKAVLTSPATLVLADWYQAGTITGAFSYRNDGNAPMTLASPSLTSPLSVASNTCTSIAAGSSCSITVALTRNANTGGSGGQTFTPSGANTAPAQTTVNWSIYSRIASWSPAVLDFGSVTTGQTATKNTTLTNTGSVVADWTSLSSSPAGYTVNLSACGNVAPAGGSCVVPITFAPTQGQDYNYTGVTPAAATIAQNALELKGAGLAVPVGEVSYTTPGTYSWTVPAGVTKVSFVAIGPGGRGSQASLRLSGGGGALVYRNDLPVTPGQTLAVVVGDAGIASSFGGATAGAGASGSSGSPAGGAPSGVYTAGFSGGYGASGSVTTQAGACAGGYFSNGCVGGSDYGTPRPAYRGSDLYGGVGSAIFGAGGQSDADLGGFPGQTGGVRIIWGPGRSFPSNAQ
jgi:hypothetical protein